MPCPGMLSPPPVSPVSVPVHVYPDTAPAAEPVNDMGLPALQCLTIPHTSSAASHLPGCTASLALPDPILSSGWQWWLFSSPGYHLWAKDATSRQTSF